MKRKTWNSSQNLNFFIIKTIKQLKWKWAYYIAKSENNKQVTHILHWQLRDVKSPKSTSSKIVVKQKGSWNDLDDRGYKRKYKKLEKNYIQKLGEIVIVDNYIYECVCIEKVFH